MHMAISDAEGGAAHRRRAILTKFRTQEFLSIFDLARSHGVSEVTIRGDIDALARKGGLTRIRGGVIRTSTFFLENPYEERRESFALDKAAIGYAAAQLIAPGDAVILDVGTTMMEIAKGILGRQDLDNVTIFTNGLNIALALEPAIGRIQIVVLGGTLRALQHSLVEPMGTTILEHITADIAFIGCNGVDPDTGVYITNLPEMTMKQHMMRAARRKVLAADASKLAQTAMARRCDISAFSDFITSGETPPEALSQIRELGVSVDHVGVSCGRDGQKNN
jgi:DeoR family transcriptional regulator of aga operon